MTELQHCPADILEIIFSNLDNVTDLHCLTSTCRHIHAIFNNRRGPILGQVFSQQFLWHLGNIPRDLPKHHGRGGGSVLRYKSRASHITRLAEKTLTKSQLSDAVSMHSRLWTGLLETKAELIETSWTDKLIDRLLAAGLNETALRYASELYHLLETRSLIERQTRIRDIFVVAENRKFVRRLAQMYWKAGQQESACSILMRWFDPRLKGEDDFFREMLRYYQLSGRTDELLDWLRSRKTDWAHQRCITRLLELGRSEEASEARRAVLDDILKSSCAHEIAGYARELVAFLNDASRREEAMEISMRVLERLQQEISSVYLVWANGIADAHRDHARTDQALQVEKDVFTNCLNRMARWNHDLGYHLRNAAWTYAKGLERAGAFKMAHDVRVQYEVLARDERGALHWPGTLEWLE